MYRILHIGSGMRPLKRKEKNVEVIHLDILKVPHVDIIADLNKGIPFRDNSFDEICANNILEHLREFKFIIEECWRVLKLNGLMRVTLPNVLNPNSWRSPFHYRGFHPDTWFYFDPSHPLCKEWGFETKARFTVVKLWIGTGNKIDPKGDTIFAELRAVK